MIRKLNIVFLLITSLLSSCALVILPHEQQVTPVYYGRILDAETGMPIAGVVVEVEALQPNSNTEIKRHASTQSDKDGNYEVGVAANLSLLGTILDTVTGPYCGGHVTFIHPGFETQSFETNVHTGRERPGGVCAGERHQRSVSLVKATSN